MGSVCAFSVCMSSSLRLQHFIQIAPTPVTSSVMISYRFLKMAVRHRNFTSGFVFGDFAHLGKSKTICRQNFGEISQLRLKYYYFRSLKTNGRHILIIRVLPISIFTAASSTFIRIGLSVAEM